MKNHEVIRSWASASARTGPRWVMAACSTVWRWGLAKVMLSCRQPGCSSGGSSAGWPWSGSWSLMFSSEIRSLSCEEHEGVPLGCWGLVGGCRHEGECLAGCAVEEPDLAVVLVVGEQLFGEVG